MTQLIQRTYANDAAQQLAREGYAPLLARIYAARGIRNAAQLDTGLNTLLPFTQRKNARPWPCCWQHHCRREKRDVTTTDGATAVVGLTPVPSAHSRPSCPRTTGYGLAPEIVRLAATRPDSSSPWITASPAWKAWPKHAG
jgi:single-stranded-DNA-specific exonuclease